MFRIYVAVSIALLVLAVSIYFVGVRRTTDKPNVIIFMADTLSAKHMSLYGYHRKTTPFIERWSKEGFLFNKSFSASSYTLTSHMSLFTGLSVHTHKISEYWEKDKQSELATEYSTLTERLKEAGYSTAWFAPTNDRHLSLSRGFERGFDIFSQVSNDAIFFTEERKEWMASHKDAPKFIFFHTYLVHDPYLPPKGFYGKFDPTYQGRIMGEESLFEKNLIEYRSRYEEAKDGATYRQFFFANVDFNDKRDIYHLEALYDEEVLYLDSLFEEWIEEIKRMGLYDNSIIIFTADHGEAFMEHGQLMHNSLNQEIVHVPLIIKFPDGLKGESSAMVQSIDLMPTLMDVLGLPKPKYLEGKSLLPLMKGKESGVHDAIFTSIGVGHDIAVQTEDWKFIRRISGEEELYDSKKDWHEEKNIVDQHPEIREKLSSELDKYIYSRTLAE